MNRCLQGTEAFEPEFGSQAHHGRRTRTSALGQISHGAERNELRIRQDNLSDASLGSRQTLAGLADAIRHFHGRRA